MNRISWEEYFMEIAKLVAKRSSCFSRQVGAVIVKDNRIISTGYNASPYGIEDCSDRGYCIRENSKQGENLNQCYAVHAEANAITQCSRNGISCKDGTMYVTTYPCINCMKIIINSGIKEIVFLEDYNDTMSKKLAYLSSITTKKYGEDYSIVELKTDINHGLANHKDLIKHMDNINRAFRVPESLFKDKGDE